MRGLGVFDAWTIHKGPQAPRCIGNIAINWNGKTLIGFENHGGRTYLGTAKPLGKVLKGYGNNAEDHTEGAVYRNAYGTYLHGSLLPKNPHFADHLITIALQRKYGTSDTREEDWYEEAEVLPEGKQNGVRPLETDELNALGPLAPLDDTLEWEAHASMLERLGLHNAAVNAMRASYNSILDTDRERK
jgi:hypothetical protein